MHLPIACPVRHTSRRWRRGWTRSAAAGDARAPGLGVQREQPL